MAKKVNKIEDEEATKAQKAFPLCVTVDAKHWRAIKRPFSALPSTVRVRVLLKDYNGVSGSFDKARRNIDVVMDLSQACQSTMISEVSADALMVALLRHISLDPDKRHVELDVCFAKGSADD